MKVYSYNPIHFEKWDWTNVETGIGGSETNAREWAWRLAARGHDVTVYAPVPWESGVQEWRGTKWRPLEEADFSQSGLWLLYRCPEALDSFPYPHPDQELWFVAQDEGNSYEWTDSRAEKADRVITLCEAHREHFLRKRPDLDWKTVVGTNGLRMDLIREIEAEGVPERNPHRLVYASSPDRGLRPLLSIFKRAREWVPDLELHITYGFDNINKLEKLNPAAWRNVARERDAILKLADQPGVHWTGRISQRELYRLWLSAGLWAYPTLFTETSCITCMEAQALGAIPITNPLWALAENVMHGVFIHGDSYADGLTQARYAAEIVRLATDEKLQEQIRAEMMPAARHRFNWERTVDQLESWLYDFDDHPMSIAQFAFQLKHAKGRILNVGCADDPAELGRLNTVNMDVRPTMPIDGRENRADVIADARCLPAPFGPAQFDTVILGDILEHFDAAEAPQIIAKAKECLVPNGRLVITVPEDYRAPDAQHLNGNGTHQYAEGISAYHRYPVTVELLAQWCRAAGVQAQVQHRIDYGNFEGWGVVAC